MIAARIDGASAHTDGVHRLGPVTVDIAAGAVTAIVGPNGSGKSTLLALLAGDLMPQQGRVEIGGTDLQSAGARSRARLRALLSQERVVEFGFTVRDVVSWGRIPWRGTPRSTDDDAVVDRLLEQFELAPLAGRAVRSLSGGERTRVHLARVLAQEAPLLLLDEADADLDLVGRHRLDAAMRSHADSGGSVVVVSHDVARIRRVCDEALLLDRGHVAAAGAAGSVITPERLQAVFGIPVSFD